MFFKSFKLKKNIWQRLKSKNPEGIFALAPMLDITDKPFRQIISELGVPDVFFTEFVSVDGICSKEGRERLLLMLKKTKYEIKNNNLIFQIFGSNPKKFKKTVKIIKKLNPAGIDINTGCPVKAIVKQNAGSALIQKKNWQKVKEIFEITKKHSGNIPVSIKTRIGFYQIDLDWIKFLLSLKPDALIIHFRTMKEASVAMAHWELAQEIGMLKEKISPNTVLIGNGDIESVKDGKFKIKQTGFDGVMIGRGIFQNPALFFEKDFNTFSVIQKLTIMFHHLDLFEKEFFVDGKWIKSFALVKKFLKIYVSGFDGAKELRVQLMEAKNLKEIEEICNLFLKDNVLG
ncbi:MAG: tRNA-dihydrouridine synthase [Candidatus Pacebacteria bacterium]|nr:tRNA-dihydrouridine synthase [Candidatus Paceibacterota bacterium]